MNQEQKAQIPEGPYSLNKLTNNVSVIKAKDGVVVLKVCANLTQSFKDRSRFLAPSVQATADLYMEALNAFRFTGKSPMELVLENQKLRDQTTKAA